MKLTVFELGGETYGGVVSMIGNGMSYRLRGLLWATAAAVVLVMATSTTGWAQSPLPPCQGAPSSWSNCVVTITSASGRQYVGEYRAGTFTGKSTDGYIYVGGIRYGKFHGQGTLTFPDGTKFVGEYRDGVAHGQGTITYANGDKYVGEWRDNKRHGQGTFTFGPSSQWAGAKYVGEWRDNKRNGQGTYTYANGDKYVGEYRDDKRTGQGTFTFANGEKYVGEFRDGNRNGQGTRTLANGEKYVGEFRDDKANGQGTLTFADGRAAQSGLWQDDKFVDPAQQAAQREQQAAQQALQSYQAREKTRLERILNYTTTANEDGSEFMVWISGFNGRHKCIMTILGIENSYERFFQPGLIPFFNTGEIDIRAFNQKGFRIRVGGNVGDEKESVPSSPETVLERLQTAWGLAFQECPGKKSDF